MTAINGTPWGASVSPIKVDLFCKNQNDFLIQTLFFKRFSRNLCPLRRIYIEIKDWNESIRAHSNHRTLSKCLSNHFFIFLSLSPWIIQTWWMSNVSSSLCSRGCSRRHDKCSVKKEPTGCIGSRAGSFFVLLSFLRGMMHRLMFASHLPTERPRRSGNLPAIYLC